MLEPTTARAYRRSLVRQEATTTVVCEALEIETTAASRINENEPLLLRDMARTLRSLAPSNAYYEHNDFGRRTVNMNDDECANGHSHCQHLFLGTSETIPVIEGEPTIG